MQTEEKEVSRKKGVGKEKPREKDLIGNVLMF